MDVGIRVILILIGSLLLVGIIWDVIRKKSSSFKSQKNDDLDLHGNESAYSKDSESIAEAKISNRANNKENSSIIEPVISLKPEEPTINSNFEASSNNNPNSNFNINNNFKANLGDSNILSNSVESLSKKFNNISSGNNSSSSSVKFSENQNLEAISISIMAKENSLFPGNKLLDSLEATSMYFGDMNIFHRYKYNNGTGHHLFSLVSAVEPGIFDLKNMRLDKFQGITLFFVVGNVQDPEESLDAMLKTAKQLAFRLNGELLDKEHKPLAINSIEDYKESLRSSLFV